MGEDWMNVTIGTAPDSWGVWFPDDPRQTPWQRFLDEVAEAGYKWIELGPYGYLPTDLSVLRSELAKRDLKVSGSFITGDLANEAGGARLEGELRALGPTLKELGASFLVLIENLYTDQLTGAPLAPVSLDTAGFQRLIDTTRHTAEIARTDYGLTLVFHSHAETHVQYEDQIEAFLDATEPELVSLLLDTGHHAYSGGDPVAFMRKHYSRIPYLHLKNVDSEVRAKVAGENMPFVKAVAMNMFVEPSRGTVDFAAFRDALRDVNYVGYGIVEQDMFPAPFDKPLPIAKRTRAYLREIGMG
jgi:inosose dehydratase